MPNDSTVVKAVPPEEDYPLDEHDEALVVLLFGLILGVVMGALIVGLVVWLV